MKYYIFLIFIVILSGFSYAMEDRVFPIGIYSVPVEALKEVKEAGFNVVQIYNADVENLDKYINEAQKNDLKVLIYPGAAIGKKNIFDFPKMREFVKKYQNNDSILAWYLVDEPDVIKTLPSFIKEVNKEVKDIDSFHKTALVIGQGSAAKKYAGIADITMIDWYPIPHLPLVSLAENVEEVVREVDLRQEKVEDRRGNNVGDVYAVLQVFDWSFYSKKAREKGIGRNPTYDEMRCMTYLSIIHGADGIFYYAFSGSYKIKEFPEHWENLKQIVKELGDIKALIIEKSIIENDIKTGNKNIHYCVKEHEGKKYLFTANVVNEKAQGRFEGILGRRIKEMFAGEESSFVVEDLDFNIEFEPYGIRVFEIE